MNQKWMILPLPNGAVVIKSLMNGKTAKVKDSRDVVCEGEDEGFET